jgi:NAD+ synthase
MQTDRVIKHIVSWLKAYCDDANLQGFVVGVSGGIDSAVASTLCAKTGKQVILLSMPIYQDPGQLFLAHQHIEWLEQNHGQVKGVIIDLTPPFQALEKSFPADIQDGLTMANTRSRIRMVTLYAFSTHHRMLVVGTGNKVEDFGVGFYTKYGDGGVDILPIADLTKSEIYAVGSELGIGKGIMDASPTDGLWDDNRTDESQIGATYAELEWAMQFEAESADEGQLNARQMEILSIYRRFHQANRHKIEPVPVCKIPEAMLKIDAERNKDQI